MPEAHQHDAALCVMRQSIQGIRSRTNLWFSAMTCGWWNVSKYVIAHLLRDLWIASSQAPRNDGKRHSEGIARRISLNKRSFAVAQLCIQAHSSSLRCGGSLCKDDKVYGNDGKKRSFGFHPQDDIEKKAAFTLAEVLITLGIIGVVAAMTLPTLINNTKDTELVSRAKKSYSEIMQAVQMYEAQNETPGDLTGLFEAKNGTKNSGQLAEDFSKYFASGAKVCKTRTEPGCSQYFYNIEYATPQVDDEGNLTASGANFPKIILPNGTIIGVSQTNECGEIIEYQKTDEYGQKLTDADGNPIMDTYAAPCAYIYFDTTGPQRPNKFGMDAFRLVVTPDKVYYGTYKPAGTESLRSIVMYGKLTYTKYKVGEKLEF